MSEDWALFNTWLEVEGIDQDRITWAMYETLNKVFQNEKKQNAWSYQRALKKFKGEE